MPCFKAPNRKRFFASRGPLGSSRAVAVPPSIQFRNLRFRSSSALKALGKEFIVPKLQEEIESIKTDVERLRSQIERLRQRRAHASANAKMPRSESFPTHRQRMRLWEKLHKAGGIVDRETFYGLAEKAGYDRNRVGGFFKGKGSLVWIDDDKVGLSARAAREVEHYCDRIRGGNATRMDKAKVPKRNSKQVEGP